MLSLTEYVKDRQNNALWDTHQHALLPECRRSIVIIGTGVTTCTEKGETQNYALYQQLVMVICLFPNILSDSSGLLQ